MAEGYLYDRGDELIERKDLSESLVPKITATTDQGKVLTVGSDDKAGWETPESGLPTITPTTDQGKVLTVGSDDEPEWGTPEGTLPTIIPTTDQGKVLTVGDDDEPEWGTPDGIDIMSLTLPSVQGIADNSEVSISFPSEVSRDDVISHVDKGGLFAIHEPGGTSGGIIVKPIKSGNSIIIPGKFVVGNAIKTIGTASFNQMVVNYSNFASTSGTTFKCQVRIITSVLAVDGTTVYPST